MTALMTPNTVTNSKQAATQPRISDLRARIAGEVILPGEAQYDDVRQQHDIMVDRRPAAIVRVASTQDVVESVRFAASAGMDLAVRSGGHSVAAHSMVDNALVIDFGTMRGVSIDPVARTSTVQPGATSADIAGPAHAYGLALSTGDTSTVGVGGLTTGGGIGWMVRKFGLAIDNLLEAEVVTAEGSVLTASERENADLFWGIRGGGGNFGVITRFTFRMAPVGQVLGGAIVVPATHESIRAYLDYVADAPDDLTTITNVMHAPPAPFIPEERIGEKVLFIMATWTGDFDEGQKALAPLRALGEVIADTMEPIPYPVIFNYTQEAAARHGASVRSMFSDDVSDETIDDILAALDRATSPISMVQLRGLGGAMARVPADATAFAHRDKRYLVLVVAIWVDAGEDDAPHRAWTTELWSRVRRDADGVYVNFLEAEGDGRIRDAYPPATLARLAEVKQKFDPTNLFRLNQNIKPAS